MKFFNFISNTAFLLITFCVYAKTKETFEYCLKNEMNPGLVSCVGQQVLSSLYQIDEQNNFTITNGLTMIKDDSVSQRSVPNLFDQDPMDFRGILENAGAIVGQRTLQWDLSMIHSGLCLRIGPSVSSNSLLEFVIDPSIGRGDRYMEDEHSTARILTRQFIVPFLLGLKFNLVTIVPLIFAAIILLCKKAAFLGKFALFITGLLGFGSLFSLNGLAGGLSGLGGGFGGGLGGGLGSFGHKPIFSDGIVHNDHGTLSGGYYKIDNPNEYRKVQQHANTDPRKEELIDNFYDYEKKVLLTDRNNPFKKEFKFKTNEDPQQQQQQQQQPEYRAFTWKTV